MIDIVRLQAYLRQNAGRWFEALPSPPFTLFIHPSDPLLYFNYAIPDEPIQGDLGQLCEQLRAEFTTRNRTPRFEFIHEFAPHLGKGLSDCGFVQASCQLLMCCTPERARPAPDVPGLVLDSLNQDAGIEDAQTFLFTQRRGFDPTHRDPATIEEAKHFLHALDQGYAFLAWLDDRPVCAGTLSTPYDGIAELSAVATEQPFRRRGIATALTAYAVQIAFRQGVEIVCLTAEDARSGRVYERVGFAAVATMLAYEEPET
jgi:GNAT superfamily N-acetyltransferase